MLSSVALLGQFPGNGLVSLGKHVVGLQQTDLASIALSIASFGQSASARLNTFLAAVNARMKNACDAPATRRLLNIAGKFLNHTALITTIPNF